MWKRTVALAIALGPQSSVKLDHDSHKLSTLHKQLGAPFDMHIIHLYLSESRVNM